MIRVVTKKRLKNNSFSLVLSGGAALGIAHIGVLKFLEENELVPNEVIGTSMGAVIASLYAIGKNSKEIIELVEEVKGMDLFKIKYGHGRIEYRILERLLKDIFGNMKLSDSKIPLKIVTTGVKHGEARVFSSNENVKIIDAVFASISIPGVFSAKKIKRNYYMDGGISSNLPVEFCTPQNLKLASNVINKTVLTGKIAKSRTILSMIKRKIKTLDISVHYLIRNQTYAKIKYIKKLILIEPMLKGQSRYRLGNYKKMIDSAYNEAAKIIH